MNAKWYHCGRCGSLFESQIGHDDSRSCPECGKDPSTGLWPAIDKSTQAKGDVSGVFEKRGETVDETGRKAVRKRREKSLMMRIMVIWLVLMSLAVSYHMYQRRTQAETLKSSDSSRPNLAKGTLADERIALLSKALPECHQSLGGFLTAGTPEARNQFVANSLETAGKMAIFYLYNPLPQVDTKELKRVDQKAIRVGDEWMIETRWQGVDGLSFDAVFRRDGTSWKLDWEHFSRFGDYPWVLFLAGEGPEEGEFRLLARRVAKGDEAERTGSRLRFTLLSPIFGKTRETGVESPEFLIDRRSEEGLLLEAAFAKRDENGVPFSDELEPMEPEGFIRVRVRMKREDFAGQRRIVLEKVEACHWLSSDDPGHNLDQLKDDLFGTR